MQRYFKLETYVGKLIMSYLNTYVRLRDDQVAMSFWGGDVILNQLELRCESLEHLFPFPVGFRSGRVHELRIHVPWTKLNSENIVITLHTVECILALKQPASRTTVEDNLADMVQPGSALSSTGFQDISASIAPGYLQSYLKRLLANIRFVVYNLNVKFLQDDIVLSLSGSVLDFHPTTPDWKPTFHSGGQESSYMIHRKLQVSDVTLCLDHSGSSGYVEVYEEPLLYRFGLSCLVKLIYARESLRLSSPIMSTLNIHAKKLDLRLSPFQLHALVRLIEVFSAIHAETFDWSKLSLANVLNVFQVETINSEVTSGSLLDPRDPLEQTVDNGQQQSWASWVWSFVPAILPPNTELSDSDDNEDNTEEDSCEDPGQASIELIQSVPDSHSSGRLINVPSSKRPSLRLRPTIKVELDSLALQITALDVHFNSLQLGVRRLRAFPMGRVCCCGQVENCFACADEPTAESPLSDRLSDSAVSTRGSVTMSRYVGVKAEGLTLIHPFLAHTTCSTMSTDHPQTASQKALPTSEGYHCLKLKTGPASWNVITPMYVDEVATHMQRWIFPAELLSGLNEKMMSPMNWLGDGKSQFVTGTQSDSETDVQLLMHIFTRMRFHCASVSLSLVQPVTLSSTAAFPMDNETEYSTVFCVPDITACLWNLNRPDYCMIKQLSELFSFVIAPTGSECPSVLPDTSFVSYFRRISRIQAIDSVDDVDDGLLCANFPGLIHTRWFEQSSCAGLPNSVLKRIARSIFTGPRTGGLVLPILQRVSSTILNRQQNPQQNSEFAPHSSVFPLLGISSQFPNEYFKTKAPTLCHAVVSDFNVLITPRLFEWLSSVSSSLHSAHRSDLRSHVCPDPVARILGVIPLNTVYPSAPQHCPIRWLNVPQLIWDTETWCSVRRFLNGIHGLFTQLNIQFLVLPSKMTVVTQNPSPAFVCQIFDVSGFSPLDLANDHQALEIVLPKLQLDNQARDVSVLDTHSTFNPIGLKIPNVSWTQATCQLPILRSLSNSNINTTSTPETVVPWFLRASDASFKLNGQTLSSGSLLATLIDTVQSCTHSTSTIDWCLHVQLVLDEPDHRRDILCIPTLEQMFQAVNSITFLVAGLRQTFSSWTAMFEWIRTDFNGQLMSRAKTAFKPNPCFSSTASSCYETSANKISLQRYSASLCGRYPVPPITGVKHQIEVLSQSPLLIITTNAPPVRFWIQCSLPRAIGCFILSSDCPDERAVLHWFVKGAVFTVDLKQDSASFEVKLGALSAELRRTNERVIPLLSPLESSFRTFDDRDLGASQSSFSVSLPTLNSRTRKCSSSRSHFADVDTTSMGVSPTLFDTTEHHCHSSLHTEGSLDPVRTVFHLVCHLSCKSSTDGQLASMRVPSASSPSEIEPVIPNLLIKGLLQPLDVFICPTLIEQLTKLCGTMDTGSQDAFPRSLSSVTLSQKSGCIGRSVQPHVLIKSFRVFYPLSRVLPRSRQSEPDTLAFCCESVELTPLVGNELERPVVHLSYITSDDPTLTSTALAADSLCPTLTLTVSVRGLSFRVTEFVSLLLPEGFIVDRSTEGRFTPFNNLSSTVLAERQNPARYWNQGILRASWNCLPHPAPAWPIIQTFSVTLSYASAVQDSQSRYIYGDALELTIPDNVVVFADCKLLKRLSSVIQSSTVSSSGNCELSQPHPVANLFDRYFHPTSSMVAIPLRLLFAVRHVRLVTWTDQLTSSAHDAIAHTVVDISHPHLSVHFKTSGESGLVDRLDYGIEDMQIDMRITKLDTENTQRRRPLNWTRFTPVAFQPCRSPISFCCPSFPLRSFAREPTSPLANGASQVLFGTGFGYSDPHTGVPKPLLIIQMMRSVDNADVIHESGTPNLNADQDPESWRQQKFDVDVNVGRAIQFSVNPGVIAAFQALIDAVLPEGQDNEVVKPVALNENKGLQWVHWALTRFTVVSGNLPSLKILLSTSCSDKLDSTATACLQCDIQRTNFCVFSDDADRLSFNRIKFQLCYQGIGIFVYPLFSLPLEQGAASSAVLMATYFANQCVSVLWPHTSLSCSGTVRIATCPHIRTAGQAYRFPVDVELMLRLDDGCRIDVPVHGPVFHALRSLISVYAPLSRVQTPSAESVGITFCDQCAAEQPILFKDDLRGRTFALPSTFQERVNECVQLATDQALSYLHPCWPWTASETCLNQLPLSKHPWPCSNGIVFCDNLRGMYHYYSVSGQFTSLPIHDQPHVDCHWIGMTWMYAEPRTPVRVRVLPVPFGFIERYSELSYPHGLELPCRLQYWDGSAEQNGTFLTYATFGLQDSKVVNLLLLQKRRFGSNFMTNSEMAGSSLNTESFSLDICHRLQSTLDDAILRNVIPSSVSDYHSHVFRGSSALVGSKVSAKIWRVLVDLRARPVSAANSNNPCGSTDISAPEAIQSRPVALVHVSPLMLAGCMELDSVQNRSLTPNQSMFCRLLCPSLHIGLLQQQEPQDDQQPNGLELARVVFSGLSLTHKCSLGSFSSETVRSLLEFEQCTVCTANPNWACLQSFCRLHRFSADVTQPSGLVRSHLVDVQLRLGVDRLVALCHLTRILGKACATWMDQNLNERSDCTREDFPPRDDQDGLDLRWVVVNCSDQIFIQSDLIVRNLLPIELDFALSTSSVKKHETHRELSHDAAKQKTVAASNRLRVQHGPSATFVCSPYTRDRQNKRVISIRLSGLQLPKGMDQRFPHQFDSDHWSDAFVFCVSTSNTEDRKLRTSQRSLITISPVFEVINRMPCPIQLQARCVRSYHSPVPTVERAAGLQSPWTEIVPAAQMVDNGTCVPHPRKPTSVPALPQSVSIPYLLTKAPDLLLTVHLSNGHALFPEPVRLSPDRVLKKLTTTFLSSSVSAVSDVKRLSSAPGHLIIRTIDYRYPSFRPKLNFVLFNCSSGIVNGDDDPLRYSLQLTVQPQLRLFNQSGVELQIGFLKNGLETPCSSYTARIADRSVLVPSQARPFIQLGHVVADHIYWSSVIIHLHPTLFALSVDVAAESAVDGHRASAKPDAFGFQDSIFNVNPNPTNIERISNAQHLTVHELRDGDCPLWLPVSIVTGRVVIFLVVRLVKKTESPILGKASSYYVVFIDSRVHVRLCSSREISFTPFVVPPHDRSSDSLKAIAVNLLSCRPISLSLLGPNTDRSSLNSAPPLSPQDEFVRLTVRGFEVVGCLSRYIGSQLDVDLTAKHFQLDNWAQNWTNKYDFPVILKSSGPTRLYARFETILSPSFLFRSPVCSVFVCPPSLLHLSVEDTLLHDTCALVSDYGQVVMCNGSRDVLEKKPHRLWFFRRLHISRCNACVSLRAVLRVYLSCHEAPLNVAPFDLCLAQLGPHNTGLALSPEALSQVVSMHYFTEAMFQAGWVFGSLDMLGNVTGLLYSFAKGLNDLVYLRPAQPQDKTAVNGATVTDKLDDSLDASQLSMTIDAHASMDHTVMHEPEWSDSQSSRIADPATTVRRIALLRRLAGGFNSFTRHTTGGLIRSVTGMAASVARNLDYLTLDTQHRQQQELTRRKQAPRDLTEGLQMGLSGFGLCVLGAVAGLADHPLQVLLQGYG
ncbi:hypothetical protein AHF37_01874 [Paragonimus kellicotti]|nr:hypothetical protein AHF37_01874 [Paragonimus kellicotti]